MLKSMRALGTILLVGAVVPLVADDSERILTIDHFVRVQSSVPAISGQPAQLYVRERVQAGMLARSARQADRVVLFVHGAGTPAEVAFDVRYQNHTTLFRASLEWLEKGTVNGSSSGILRMGY
jgi:hypothetical protein